jgi:hypothetical protein
VTDLARILARALALDIEEYPEGPSAEASATSGTGGNRSRPERIISERLHPDDCGTHFRVVA